MYRYSEHHSAELLCQTYAWDDEKVNLWIPFEPGPVFRRIVEYYFKDDPRIAEVHWGGLPGLGCGSTPRTVATSPRTTPCSSGSS